MLLIQVTEHVNVADIVPDFETEAVLEGSPRPPTLNKDGIALKCKLGKIVIIKLCVLC